MKTYKIFTVLLSMVLFNLTLTSQINRSKNISADNNTAGTSVETASGQSVNSDAYGSSGVEYNFDYGIETGMYLDENWLPGEIVLFDETVFSDRLLRYNIYTRQMEFVYKGDTMAIANTDEIRDMKIGNRKFIFESFTYNDESENDWLEVLVDGDYSLYQYRRIVYRYVEDISESNAETDRFFMTEKYYVQDDGSKIKELPNTRKQIVRCLTEKNSDIESYMKKNKLKLTREGDLVKLVEFCNRKKE